MGDQAHIREIYEASYRRLVTQMYGITGDRHTLLNYMALHPHSGPSFASFCKQRSSRGGFRC